MSEKNILEEIAEKTRERIRKEKRQFPLDQMKTLAEKAPQQPSFLEALKKPGMSYICEVKKASPSKGLIAPEFLYLEIAKEYEAPRMSIQTKDLIRYTNHTIHQKKNHAKPIQKFHHNSTHSQPTTKHLDTLPADSEAPRPTPFPSNHKETQPFLHAVQRSADGSSNSRPTTLTLPP